MDIPSGKSLPFWAFWGRVSLFCDPRMLLEIIFSDLYMHENVPMNVNINFPGMEPFPSLVRKKFPAKEITSLAVKLFPNIGELA